jgi:hypothetical protein
MENKDAVIVRQQYALALNRISLLLKKGNELREKDKELKGIQ